jgi:hypothetical protein
MLRTLAGSSERTLAGSSERAEADRTRAILLTLSGWTSARIAQAFAVREDTVRFWRSEFLHRGVDGLRKEIAGGPEPVKAQAALRVAADVLSGPVAEVSARTRSDRLCLVERSGFGVRCC